MTTLQEYSQGLDRMVDMGTHSIARFPWETEVRVGISVECMGAFSREALAQVLAIAIDRLAGQKIGLRQ